MEAVCIKMEHKIMQEMETCIEEENYSTKTEFIREAVREKIKAIRKERALRMLEANFGKGGKSKYTDAEFERLREKVAEEYLKKRDLILD
ncbi:MAG: ribbon-helix-helix domain-containing protein [Nanoarchaeota archaeon]|nr:ribbon-helix-helix domain-containing protein [Nanoarchaeota archaeon]